MSATDTRQAPPDAIKLRPAGAEGLTYAIHLVDRDDVQSWSEPAGEWLDGANGGRYEGDATATLWWRWKPEMRQTYKTVGAPTAAELLVLLDTPGAVPQQRSDYGWWFNILDDQAREMLSAVDPSTPVSLIRIGVPQVDPAALRSHDKGAEG